MNWLTQEKDVRIAEDVLVLHENGEQYEGFFRRDRDGGIEFTSLNAVWTFSFRYVAGFCFQGTTMLKKDRPPRPEKNILYDLILCLDRRGISGSCIRELSDDGGMVGFNDLGELIVEAKKAMMVATEEARARFLIWSKTGKPVH